MTDMREERVRVVRSHPSGHYATTAVPIKEELRARGADTAEEAADLLRHAANVFGFLDDCIAEGLGSGANREGVRSVLNLSARAMEEASGREGVTLFDLGAALRRAAPGHRHPDERETDHDHHD